MSVKSQVKSYYGEVLASSADLKTDACCTIEETPAAVARALQNIHPAVSERYYGCGLVFPDFLGGARILDLGCGAGRDAYALAQFVGADGAVVGVDMTPAQLAVARRHQDWHAKRFGFDVVSFVDGDIENLGALALEPASFDVIVSNCVINLSTDKLAIFSAARDLLKPGGELYFADVYADQRLDPGIAEDPVARGECLGGALYWRDFLVMAAAAGFSRPRLVASRALAINDASLAQTLSGVAFQSATYRLFRPLSKAMSEAGGVNLTYRPQKGDPEAFVFDRDTRFRAGMTRYVESETAAMILSSRFKDRFTRADAAGDADGVASAGDEALSPFSAQKPPQGCC